MIKSLLRRLFGTVNDRYLASLHPIIKEINGFEEVIERYSDQELRNQTKKFQKQLKNKEKSLDDILPEAFATVREASKRILGLRHYDVQMMGGIALHRGMVAEMRTGEGKTLVATLPSYLNALEGKGVHVVTVNDYLAQRDTEWVGKIHIFLGLTVGCILNSGTEEEHKDAYNCDITYSTNNELGFDYLRDNMRYFAEHAVQRPFNYAIIDEVDSILIDEARTPLVISGPSDNFSQLYYVANDIIPLLKKEHYDLDEKARNVSFTEEGIILVEKELAKQGVIEQGSSLFDIDNINVIHHMNQALKAHKNFKRDVDYLIKDNQIMIIDEFTGRIMEGRRFSEGLHQALEAREGVPIQNENQTLASITFQNYFRLYPKISGMTGTAVTEAVELQDIYGLKVLVIPTNNPMIRKDEDDQIYRTAEEKFEAIIEEITKCHAKKQPILVGTASVEMSEFLSKILKKEKIKHNVLNAKNHEREAHIIAQAGQLGAVTIATNMAGRGTDIMLGGNAEMLFRDPSNKKSLKVLKEEVAKDKKEILEVGGLLVIGTERHESRRIDNQLRGRSGRMGDPGRTVFYISLEDDLMRIFASQNISKILKTLGLKRGEAIYHPMITRTISKAQQKVEHRNYEIRKNLLKFDNVMNDQRKVIYEQRQEIMSNDDILDVVDDIYHDLNQEIVSEYIPEGKFKEEWDIEAFSKRLISIYGSDFDILSRLNKQGNESREQLEKYINDTVKNILDLQHKKFGTKLFKAATQRVLLITLDQLWKDHLLSLDHLRHGIYLRAFGQKDPLSEYKREAFNYFAHMLSKLKETYITRICRMEIDHDSDDNMLERKSTPMHEGRQDVASLLEKSSENDEKWGKVGRNETCPCGSGKKFKHCHGKI